jgi:hypothetical protein
MGSRLLQCADGKERVEIELFVRVKPCSVMKFFFLLFLPNFFLFSSFFFFPYFSLPVLLLYFSLTVEEPVRCVNSHRREEKRARRLI